MLASLQNNCVKAEASYKQLLQKLATQGNASNIPGLSVPGATAAPTTTNATNASTTSSYPSATYPSTGITTGTYPSTGMAVGAAAGVTAAKLGEIGQFPSLSSVGSFGGAAYPSAT